MSIPRKVGYAVLSVDGNETSEHCSEVESLGTAAAEAWDEAARVTVDPEPRTSFESEVSSSSSFSAVSMSDTLPPTTVGTNASLETNDEVVHLLSAIHTTLRRLVQQQTAVIDGLKLLHADGASHQKESCAALKQMAINSLPRPY